MPSFTHSSLYYSLLSYKGIGPKTASFILHKLGFTKKTKVTQLTSADLDKLNLFLSYLRNLTQVDGVFSPIENNLNISNSQSLKSLFSTHSYRSSRLYLGYPANGQRTRSNANTAKRLRSQ